MRSRNGPDSGDLAADVVQIDGHKSEENGDFQGLEAREIAAGVPRGRSISCPRGVLELYLTACKIITKRPLPCSPLARARYSLNIKFLPYAFVLAVAYGGAKCESDRRKIF